jgi:hypothetical protein
VERAAATFRPPQASIYVSALLAGKDGMDNETFQLVHLSYAILKENNAN